MRASWFLYSSLLLATLTAGACDGGTPGKDPCEGRVCGVVEGRSCGTCPGATDYCDEFGQCVDACLERQCGTGAEGIDCGTCPGATEHCDDQGSCVDACAGRECGEPLPGIDCGTCAPPEQCGLAGNCFSPGGCPADAVEITGQGYCIDSHEATNARYRDFLEVHGNDCYVEAYHDQYAGSGLHSFECHSEQLGSFNRLGLSGGQWVVEAGYEDHPVSFVTLGGANLACEQWGGHLCKLEEWQGACHGPQGLAFPYGDEYDPLVCNACDVPTGGMCGDWSGDTVAVGSYAGCEGGYPGLFDMSGNVLEWVDHCLWIEHDYFPEILKCVQKGGSISGELISTAVTTGRTTTGGTAPTTGVDSEASAAATTSTEPMQACWVFFSSLLLIMLTAGACDGGTPGKDPCEGRVCGEVEGRNCGTCASSEQCGQAGNCFSPGGRNAA